MLSKWVPAVAQWVNDPACLFGVASLIPCLVRWVKDLALLQLWCRSQLQLRFSPWRGHFHIPRVLLKKPETNTKPKTNVVKQKTTITRPPPPANHLAFLSLGTQFLKCSCSVGVPLMAQRKRIRLETMRLPV